LQTVYSVKGLRENYGEVRKIEQSIESDAPTLSLLVNSLGTSKIENYIKLWIINLMQSLDLKRTLSENQIDECAFLIVSTYRSMKVTDINIIFNEAKLGKYGEFYESLTMSKILLWFRMYEEERQQAWEFKSQREAQSYKYNAPRNNKTESIRDQKAVVLNSKDLNQLKNK